MFRLIMSNERKIEIKKSGLITEIFVKKIYVWFFPTTL